MDICFSWPGILLLGIWTWVLEIKFDNILADQDGANHGSDGNDQDATAMDDATEGQGRGRGKGRGCGRGQGGRSGTAKKVAEESTETAENSGDAGDSEEKNMRRPASSKAQRQDKAKTKAGAKRKAKAKAKAQPEENPFDQPPPEGQESLGMFFHVRPKATQEGAAVADSAEEPLQAEDQENQETKSTAESPAKSSSSSSSSSSDDPVNLVYESNQSDELAPMNSSPNRGGRDDDVSQVETSPTRSTIQVRDPLDQVTDFDSMFRFAERNVERVYRFLVSNLVFFVFKGSDLDPANVMPTTWHYLHVLTLVDLLISVLAPN